MEGSNITMKSIIFKRFKKLCKLRAVEFTEVLGMRGNFH